MASSLCRFCGEINKHNNVCPRNFPKDLQQKLVKNWQIGYEFAKTLKPIDQLLKK